MRDTTDGYAFPIDQCDVESKEALQQFRQKRQQWQLRDFVRCWLLHALFRRTVMGRRADLYAANFCVRPPPQSRPTPWVPNVFTRTRRTISKLVEAELADHLFGFRDVVRRETSARSNCMDSMIYLI
jgi:hypothetical protein